MDISRLTVKKRLLVYSLVVFVGLIVLIWVALSGLRDSLLEDRRIKTKHAIEISLGVLSHYHELQQSGALSRQEAQKLAAAVVAKMSYGDNDYFWINDMNGIFVMHPIKPELVGKDGTATKDPKGAPYMQMFLTEARKPSGRGFVDYHWTKKGPDDIVPKISYVARFPGWDWMIGTGIYIDDVNAAFWQQAKILIVVVGIMLPAMFIVSFLINRSLLRQLGGEPNYAAEAAGRIAIGDLSEKVVYDKNYGESSLLAAMSTMRSKLAGVIANIRRLSKNLPERAEQLSNAAHDISIVSSKQAESTASSAAAIEEMTVSINEVAGIAHLTETSSEQTANLAKQGASLADTTCEQMDRVSHTLVSSAQQVQLLKQSSLEIGNIVNVIRDIAEQTNLLALNAAIEAARAGDMGRGFAVVADEVRKLAERTTEATLQINKTIESIQVETEKAVHGMSEMEPQVASGIQHTRDISETLRKIVDEANGSLLRVREVVTATKSQVAAMTDIAQHVEGIANMADSTNVTIRANVDQANELRHIANELHKLIAQFKTADE